MSTENISVGNSALFYGVFQGAGDVFLSDDLGEPLWTVLARQNLVAHEWNDDYTVICWTFRPAP